MKNIIALIILINASCSPSKTEKNKPVTQSSTSGTGAFDGVTPPDYLEFAATLDCRNKKNEAVYHQLTTSSVLFQYIDATTGVKTAYGEPSLVELNPNFKDNLYVDTPFGVGTSYVLRCKSEAIDVKICLLNPDSPATAFKPCGSFSLDCSAVRSNKKSSKTQYQLKLSCGSSAGQEELEVLSVDDVSVATDSVPQEPQPKSDD
ncbi:MAG: hypothetical protein EOP04_07620 [Proteobacteria bacterium]|nr:MAG: hypothetical protein EOP04_07620 [Pseudomonadota bacterium]